MASRKVKPKMLYAAEDGSIYDHPDLLMLCRRGEELALPRPDELVPLPEECELFLLPKRRALGLDPETGKIEQLEGCAVAAFVCPGYTLGAHAAYRTESGTDVPVLPLFAYAAVGWDAGRFWVCAKRVDTDIRQIFTGISKKRIQGGARRWQRESPDNRLVGHLCHCALGSCCPAARNLFLGRYEAPLPTSRTCNAACVGCISMQSGDSGFPSNQSRISFQPTPAEIVEIMQTHLGHESRPVYSFGQGCEGEPLMEADLIAEAVRLFRKQGGTGTVNINTNGSRPEVMPMLASAGVDSIRVSLNSAYGPLYAAYYRPKNYVFEDVRSTILAAKENGLFVSFNYLYFPGISDTEREFDHLTGLIRETGVDYIQLRNLNLDPELYWTLATGRNSGTIGPAMGLANFLKRLRREFPEVGTGYFNPFVLKEDNGKLRPLRYE